MIVFKTFLKVLDKCKVPVILFTVMLVFFGVFNFNNEDSSLDFTDTKADIVILNKDVNEGITRHIIDYMKSKNNVIDISESEEIDDALFYRNVNFVMIIPNGFREDFMNGKNPKIEVKSTGDYNSSLASMMLDRYLSVANVYKNYLASEDEIINYVDKTMSIDVEPEVASKLDVDSLSKLTHYFNFMNYSILAGLVYSICLILSSFKNEKIMKRTIISSMEYSKLNRNLILSNGLFAFVLWLIYIVLGVILLGDVLFSAHGIICIVNSFIFSMCALVMAFLIGNVVKSKNAVSGIVNVVALGSSFLCGAFVPVEFMPESVLNIGKILPSYWYINTNEMIKTIEIVNLDSIMGVIKNMGVIVLFIVFFVILTNVISYKKRKFA